MPSPDPHKLNLMPHDFRCGAFDCGVQSVNEALRGELLTAIREGRSRAYYVEQNRKCLGFFALRAESFHLSDSIDRERYSVSSRHVPGVLLELIGVDKTAQGQGLGEQLLLAAIALAQQVSSLVAARFLVLESLPNAVRFYRRRGFIPTMTQGDSGTTFMVLDLWEGK